MSKNYWVYIMTNKKHGTLYVGVTSNLAKRIGHHHLGQGSEFVKKWGLKKLVYAESYQNVELAIAQEKRLKKWRRQWKIQLIEKANPDWDDLLEHQHLTTG